MRFTKHIREKGSSLSGKVEGDTTILSDNAPDQEAIEAFVLTFRLFLVNNEPIAIRRMPGLYANLAVPDRAKELLRAGCDNFNARLDAPSFLASQEGPITNRQILDTFMYGGLVHTNNPQAVARYEEWQSEPVVYAFFRLMFITVLMDCLAFIFWMRGFHRHTIRVIEGVNEPQ